MVRLNLKLKNYLIAPVYADGIVNPALPSLGSGEGVEIMGRLISTIITVLFVGGVLASFMYLIIGAYRWISAKGDKNYLQEARETVMQAIIGLGILFTIFAILSLVGDIFGINLISLPVPNVGEGQPITDVPPWAP